MGIIILSACATLFFFVNIRQNTVMVYIAGIVGFIFGFGLGQYILLLHLKDRPREDLLNDKSLKYTYGVLNWIIAGAGAYGFVWLYRFLF